PAVCGTNPRRPAAGSVPEYKSTRTVPRQPRTRFRWFSSSLFSPGQPDQTAEQQHRAGQCSQQQPADFALLGPGHEQSELGDWPWPDSFEQGGAVKQPVDRVTDKVAVAAAIDVPIAQENRIARDQKARVAARICH